MSRLFTYESVSEGHPDKIADQVSDAILDAILAQDKTAHVACETLVKTGLIMVAGEITTSANIDFEAVARKTVCDIGYDNSNVGFDGHYCAFLNALGKQSPDINQGVSRTLPEDPPCFPQRNGGPLCPALFRFQSFVFPIRFPIWSRSVLFPPGLYFFFCYPACCLPRTGPPCPVFHSYFPKKTRLLLCVSCALIFTFSNLFRQASSRSSP